MTLLSQSDSDIVKYLKDYESQCKNLKLEILKICWFMRGGVTHMEAMNMGPQDRQIVAQLVKENLDTTKKTGRDFF